MKALLVKQSPEYYPMAEPLMRNAKKLGVAVDFLDSAKYDDTLVFHNRPSKRGKWWMCDLRDPNELPDGSPEHIYLCNIAYKKQYEQKYGCKVTYLPQCGFDYEIKKGRKIEWDVVFIGNTSGSKYHSGREELIRELNAHHIQDGRYTKDSPWIYRKTPISLSKSLAVAGYTSNRLYNILASGGFCLTNYFPGIEYLFENHRHLVWFKSVAEAKELAKYYLNHRDKRDKIARWGNLLYEEKHTPIERLKLTLDL